MSSAETSPVAGSCPVQQQMHALYSEHHGWLRGWLRRKLGDAHHAADLAHDTFVRVLAGARGKSDEDGATRSAPLQLGDLREPRAYLTTVAHGLMVNQLRRRDLERAYLQALAHQPEATAPDPQTQLIVVEALLAIDTLLAGLPNKVRQAFVLSQLEGLRYAEIATRLGVSLSMVKKYMLQATAHCLRVAA